MAWVSWLAIRIEALSKRPMALSRSCSTGSWSTRERRPWAEPAKSVIWEGATGSAGNGSAARSMVPGSLSGRFTSSTLRPPREAAGGEAGAQPVFRDAALDDGEDLVPARLAFEAQARGLDGEDGLEADLIVAEAAWSMRESTSMTSPMRRPSSSTGRPHARPAMVPEKIAERLRLGRVGIGVDRVAGVGFVEIGGEGVAVLRGRGAGHEGVEGEAAHEERGQGVEVDLGPAGAQREREAGRVPEDRGLGHEAVVGGEDHGGGGDGHAVLAHHGVAHLAHGDALVEERHGRGQRAVHGAEGEFEPSCPARRSGEVPLPFVKVLGRSPGHVVPASLDEDAGQHGLEAR
jgi:hypothetical protein